MTLEVIKKIALISGSETGFRKELNIVSWNGREPKYDLRSWSPEGIALRGLTLTEDEVKELQKVLNDMFSEQTEQYRSEWTQNVPWKLKESKNGQCSQ